MAAENGCRIVNGHVDPPRVERGLAAKRADNLPLHRLALHRLRNPGTRLELDEVPDTPNTDNSANRSVGLVTLELPVGGSLQGDGPVSDLSLDVFRNGRVPRQDVREGYANSCSQACALVTPPDWCRADCRWPLRRRRRRITGDASPRNLPFPRSSRLASKISSWDAGLMWCLASQGLSPLARPETPPPE